LGATFLAHALTHLSVCYNVPHQCSSLQETLCHFNQFFLTLHYKPDTDCSLLLLDDVRDHWSHTHQCRVNVTQAAFQFKILNCYIFILNYFSTMLILCLSKQLDLKNLQQTADSWWRHNKLEIEILYSCD